MNRIYLTLTRLLICSAVLAGCNQKSETAKTENTKEHSADIHAGMDHSKHESMDAGEPSDMSVYQLEGEWTNQNAEVKKLSDLGDKKVQLVALVYASCSNACPRIIADMQQIEAQLPEDSAKQLSLVLVSIDPEVDTPEKLKDLAAKSHLSQKWSLLQGSPEQVLELAAVLGVKYKKISDTDYAHSNIISVLNPAGEVKHQQTGLGVDPQATLAAIDTLLKSAS